MKAQAFISILTISILLTFSMDLFGQSASTKNAKSSTLSPAVEAAEMQYKDLPMAVMKAVETDKYSSWKVDKVYKVGKRTPGSAHHYMIRYQTGKGNEFTDVYLDENGEILDPQGSASESDSNMNN
ncbi:MAG: hypothetical protein GC178_16110 [Flavobacteriales bacterium]|nr:hypothetical protein [Flavobacteriales bacterium]